MVCAHGAAPLALGAFACVIRPVQMARPLVRAQSQPSLVWCKTAGRAEKDAGLGL